MPYNVVSKRPNDGEYQLSYGRGAKKLTATATRILDAEEKEKWVLDIPGQNASHHDKYRQAKEAFAGYAVENYDKTPGPAEPMQGGEETAQVDEAVSSWPDEPEEPVKPLEPLDVLEVLFRQGVEGSLQKPLRSTAGLLPPWNDAQRVLERAGRLPAGDYMQNVRVVSGGSVKK